MPRSPLNDAKIAAIVTSAVPFSYGKLIYWENLQGGSLHESANSVPRKSATADLFAELAALCAPHAPVMGVSAFQLQMFLRRSQLTVAAVKKISDKTDMETTESVPVLHESATSTAAPSTLPPSQAGRSGNQLKESSHGKVSFALWSWFIMILCPPGSRSKVKFFWDQCCRCCWQMLGLSVR